MPRSKGYIELYNRPRKMRMIKEIVVPLTFVVLLLPRGVFAQDQPMKVKGNHELGETVEQFFAEGQEKEVLTACMAGDFKSVNKSSRRQLCQTLEVFAG